MRGNRWRALLAISFVVSGLPIAPAIADDDVRQAETAEVARLGRTVWRGFRERLDGLRVTASQSMHAGAEYDDTHLSWHGTGIGVDGALPVFGSDQVFAFSASSAVVFPEARGSSDFIDLGGATDDPFDPLVDGALRVGGRVDLGHGFASTLTAGLSARHEIGARLGDALIAGGSFAFEYRLADWLHVRAGVGLAAELEANELSPSPVFRLRVRPVEGLWLEADTTSGKIEWEASSRQRLHVYGGVDQRRYRLDERAGTIGAGALEFRTAELGLGWRQDLGRRLRLTAEAALVLEQRITVLDRRGGTVDARESRDPSAVLRVSLAWTPLRRARPPE